MNPLLGGGERVRRNTLGTPNLMGEENLSNAHPVPQGMRKRWLLIRELHILLLPLALTHSLPRPHLQAVRTGLGVTEGGCCRSFLQISYEIMTSCGPCTEITASHLVVLRTQSGGSETQSRNTGNIPVAFLLWS